MAWSLLFRNNMKMLFLHSEFGKKVIGNHPGVEYFMDFCAQTHLIVNVILLEMLLLLFQIDKSLCQRQIGATVIVCLEQKGNVMTLLAT